MSPLTGLDTCWSGFSTKMPRLRRCGGRRFEFPEFPAAGPKLKIILDAGVPDKYTLAD